MLRVDDAEADGFLPIDASGYGPGHFSPVAPILARSPAPKREAEKKGTVFGSVVNLCATAMGAGVLSLPHAFAQMGALLGIMTVYIIAFFSDMSLVFLSRCSQCSDRHSFEGVATHYLGARGAKILNAALVVLLFGGSTLMMIVIMDLLPRVVQGAVGGVCTNPDPDAAANWSPPVDGDCWFGSRLFVGMVAVAAVFPLNLVKDLRALKYTSACAVFCLGYFVSCLVAKMAKQGHLYRPPDSDATDVVLVNSKYTILIALPIVLSAYLCQFNIFKIEAELRSSDKHKINRVIHIAMLGIAATVYAFGGLLGYFLFGANVRNDLLKEFKNDDVVMQVARGAIGLTNMLKIPLLMMPFREAINAAIIIPLCRDFCSDSFLRKKPVVAAETLAIMAVLFLAAYFLESISKDLALLGCTAGTTICFILPSIIYLRCLDDADRAKVSPSTLQAWSWGSVGGRRIDRIIAYAMLYGGVLMSVSSMITTLVHWNDMQ